MLYFNLKRIMDIRGIERPYSWLVQNGFVAQTASNWAKNWIGYIKPSQMEKLCLLLNCTPNDLFDWRPDTTSSVPESHALRSLNRATQSTELRQKMSEIPLDKLEKLEAMIAELKNPPPPE